MNRIKRGEKMVEQEETIRFKSGTSIPFLLTSTPLRGLDQGVIGLVVTFSDISERKHSEEILQRTNRELERLATEDGLTKLHNRRRFDEYLEIEWRRQSRAHKPIALVLGDVDFFKNYNDLYGHQAGDACLKAVADAIRMKARRPADLIARYGGEEFAVIMPETDGKGAWHVAEGIRLELAEKAILHGNSSVAPYVTISFGVASLFPGAGISPQALIKDADRALYRAKQEGRNRVIQIGTAVSP